jgi:hypothetical protein
MMEQWSKRINRFDAPGEALYGAFEGKLLIGVCGINRAKGERAGRLRHLYVHPAFRR